MEEHQAQSARDFVKSVTLPAAPPRSFDVFKSAPFDAAKEQASVVGSEVIAFARGVSAASRNDITNAALLAQLVAKKQCPEPKSLQQVTDWYETYFDTLARIGFVIQDKGFAEYTETSDAFEAHEAIIEAATTLLAGAPGALILVKTTLGALQKMSADRKGLPDL